MIRKITISGFRGVLHPLELPFATTPNSPTIIYGRNGTGKSSITDAWEWFHSGKIGHLKREGAEEASYPHKKAGAGETYVNVDFDDPSLGTIRLSFDNGKITIPQAHGDIDKFRSIAPHICQIRYADLTRFVYQTKSEKFAALAVLMGFTPQVELQRELARIERELKQKVETLSATRQGEATQLLHTLSISTYSDAEALAGLNLILKRHGISSIVSLEEARVATEKLNNLIVSDSRTARLAEFTEASKWLNTCLINEATVEILRNFSRSIKDFIEQGHKHSSAQLLKLYTEGEKLLRLHNAEEGGAEDKDKCPLCGQEFNGNLLQHIEQELDGLKQLQDSQDVVQNLRENAQKNLPYETLFQSPDGAILKTLLEIQGELTKDFDLILKRVQVAIPTVRSLLAVATDAFKFDQVNELESAIDNLNEARVELNNCASKYQELLKPEINLLVEHNRDRQLLVNDYAVCSNAIRIIDRMKQIEKEHKSQLELHDDFFRILADYSKSSIEDVHHRFSLISADVKKYFEILEQDTGGLENATLKLISTEDNAVELEVEHYGESVYPAYKYLSESQLNSFGLAVFLASAKFFNPEFSFLVLDDIINSLDSFKRPRVIQLLKQEFNNYQLLILTHDSIWRDKLFEAFPSSKKIHFHSWNVDAGPRAKEALMPIDKIRQFLDEDEPETAGRELGPFLERKFQELGENFEMLVTYNRSNQYTLDPLVDRLRIRVEDKLGGNHPLAKAVKELYKDLGFRNVLSHAKDVESPFSVEEIRLTVELWEKVESLVRCSECGEYVRYKRSDSAFQCSCGSAVMKKD